MNPDVAAFVLLRRPGHRRGLRDHLHPGRPAADPDPVRQPRPRPADVPGRPDVPAAAGQPGRRHPDHLRRQHPAVPAQLASYFTSSEITIVSDIATWIVNFFNPQLPIYIVLYFLLTLGFTYFYTAFTFKPDETAEQLRKNGGFIPGIRPGRPTQDYLARVVTGSPFAGALFLAIVAVSPSSSRSPCPTSAALGLGGTSLLIVVSRRRRDDETDRGAADDAQLRRLHPMTGPDRSRAPTAALAVARREASADDASWSCWEPPAPARAPRRRLSPTDSASPVAASGDLFRAAVAAGHGPRPRGATGTWSAASSSPTTSPSGCFLDRLARADAGRRDPRRLPADRGPGQGARPTR